jgi:hypothetical protein
VDAIHTVNPAAEGHFSYPLAAGDGLRLLTATFIQLLHELNLALPVEG